MKNELKILVVKFRKRTPIWGFLRLYRNKGWTDWLKKEVRTMDLFVFGNKLSVSVKAEN